MYIISVQSCIDSVPGSLSFACAIYELAHVRGESGNVATYHTHTTKLYIHTLTSKTNNDSPKEKGEVYTLPYPPYYNSGLAL